MRRTERKIRVEALLGISGALLLIGSLAPWESAMNISANALNTWQGNAAFFGSIITIFASTVSYGVYESDLLQKLTPYTDGVLGLIGSAIALIGAITFFNSTSPGASATWGLYLTIIAGLLGVVSAFALYKQKTPSIPKGLAHKGVEA